MGEGEDSFAGQDRRSSLVAADSQDSCLSISEAGRSWESAEERAGAGVRRTEVIRGMGDSWDWGNLGRHPGDLGDCCRATAYWLQSGDRGGGLRALVDGLSSAHCHVTLSQLVTRIRRIARIGIVARPLLWGERAVINSSSAHCRARRPPIGPRARPSIRGRMAQIPAGNGHVTSDNQTERRSPPNTIAVGRGRLDLAPAFGKPLSPPAYKNYPAGPRTPALFPFPITICTQWLEAQCLLSTVAGPLLGNLAGLVSFTMEESS